MTCWLPIIEFSFNTYGRYLDPLSIHIQNYNLFDDDDSDC